MDQIREICRAKKWSLGVDQGDAVTVYCLSKAIGTCVYGEASEKVSSQRDEL